MKTVFGSMGDGSPGGTENTRIQGNQIGTNIDGNSTLSNGWGNRYGIYIAGHVDSDGVTHPVNNVLIGGTEEGEGNLISGNRNAGILAFGPGVQGLSIQGNMIGTDIDGADALPNGTGVLIQDASGVLVGGTDPEARNVISGNGAYGVVIQGANSTGNAIEGNYIGTDSTGTLDRGNANSGVLLEDSTNNTIRRNVISGNGDNGVFIVGSTPATDVTNLIEANNIGTDATGTQDLGNTLMGVRVLRGTGPVIRGNVVSGNDNSNLLVDSLGSEILIEGNFIGTDFTGNATLQNPQGLSAVGVTLAGRDNIVRENVISANQVDGVNIDGGSVGDGRASGNLIENNLIGVGLDGVTPLGNGRDGIRLWRGASNNTIGGTFSSTGNVIAGNSGSAILVSGAASADNAIQGNYIGTDATGNQNIGNGGWNVVIQGAPNNLIGGTTPESGNVIAGGKRLRRDHSGCDRDRQRRSIQPHRHGYNGYRSLFQWDWCEHSRCEPQLC